MPCLHISTVKCNECAHLHTNHHKPMKNIAENAIMEAAFKLMLMNEAIASVRLDKDPGCHTCCDQCAEYPGCPGNQQAENVRDE